MRTLTVCGVSAVMVSDRYTRPGAWFFEILEDVYSATIRRVGSISGYTYTARVEVPDEDEYSDERFEVVSKSGFETPELSARWAEQYLQEHAAVRARATGLQCSRGDS